MGLLHKRQRSDRDSYVIFSDASAFGPLATPYRDSYSGRGPFDYASVMNYSSVGAIPRGIPVDAGRQTAGIIDGAAKLSGTVPTATAITTNPADLAILVDGESAASPTGFDWSPGSEHTLHSISPQTIGTERFVFGRWNDDAHSRRTVTAGAESRDGFHVLREPVDLEADAVGSGGFCRLSPVPGLRRPSGRHSMASCPAASPNPASGATPRWSRWSFHGSGISEVAAIYTEKPTFLVNSNVDGTRILLGDEARQVPWAFPADVSPNGICTEAPETGPEKADSGDIRYRFHSWGDGGSRARRIDVPASGGSVSLQFTREYRPRIGSRNRPDGALIEVSPFSEDVFYAEGTQVHVRVGTTPERLGDR